MLAQIGTVIFEAREIPFSKLQLERKAIWSQHRTLKGGFFLSFTGREARKIEIAGTLLNGFHDGLSQLEELNKLCDSGNPVSFIATTRAKSHYFGLWAITSLHEEHTIFDSSGHAKKIDFRLELLEVSYARNQNSAR